MQIDEVADRVVEATVGVVVHPIAIAVATVIVADQETPFV